MITPFTLTMLPFLYLLGRSLKESAQSFYGTATREMAGEMQRLVRETPGRVSDFLDAEAEQMKNNIKLSFGTSPAGRAYKRGSVVHIASIKDYPPNVDTEALRASIDWETIDQFTRRIHDGEEHGIYMEFGTEKSGGHVAPRPFMGPEFENTRRRWRTDAIAFGLIK